GATTAITPPWAARRATSPSTSSWRARPGARWRRSPRERPVADPHHEPDLPARPGRPGDLRAQPRGRPRAPRARGHGRGLLQRPRARGLALPRGLDPATLAAAALPARLPRRAARGRAARPGLHQ